MVELIVVIAILAILATLAFISIQWFTLWARNSARVSDISTIRSALSFYGTEKWTFPTPDNHEELTYSGVTLLKQWVFWESVRRKIGKISEYIIDPVLITQFDYGILGTRSEYQVATSYELYAGNSSFIDTVHAYNNDNARFEPYVVWTYDSYDANAFTWATCSMITLPSLLLSEIPSDWVLVIGDAYKFTYHKWPNLAKAAYEATDKSSAWRPFVVDKVYDSCTVDVVDDIDLYIARLSTSYQQYADSPVYENIVFTSDSKAFRARTAVQLDENRIEVSQALVDFLDSPTPDIEFLDDFTGIDNTTLTSHVNLIGSWNMEAWSPASYILSWNRLQKNDNSSSSLFPVPAPAISSPNSDVEFEITNFSWWNIITYLRYDDALNYYSAEINENWYRLIRMLWGVESVIQDIAEPIATPVIINFSSRSTLLTLSIWWIEKENLNIGWVVWVWRPLLFFENSWASIDNYTLRYR